MAQTSYDSIERSHHDRHLAADYWDILSAPLVISFPDDPGAFTVQNGTLPPGVKRLIIERDRQYKLIGFIEGQEQMDIVSQYVRNWESSFENLPQGSILPDRSIKIMISGREWEIRNFLITEQKVTAELVAGLAITTYRICFHLDGISYSGGAVFHLDEKIRSAQQASIHKSYKCADVSSANTNPRLFIDWHLNGSKSLFPRPSESIFFEDYMLKDADWRQNPSRFRRRRISVRRGFTLSYFRFKYDRYTVKVRRIDGDGSYEIGPNWSQKVAIEYHCQSHEVPTKSQRETITELVSFLLGRHLLRVGSSCFLLNELASFDAISPWGDDIISICSSADNNPIDLDFGNSKIEKLIEKLLPAYEVQRRDVHINELIWALWIAKRMPVSLDLPIYASALESLSATYLKKNGWSSKKDFLSNPEKNAIIQAVTPLLDRNHYRDDILKQIKEISIDGLSGNLRRKIAKAITPVIRENRYREIILKKVDTIRDITIGERLRIFFRELDLELGTVENLAIKARNDVVHRMALVDSNSDDGIRYGATYRALVHRVLLRLLGYTGKYVDYSVPGLASKPLRKAQG